MRSPIRSFAIAAVFAAGPVSAEVQKVTNPLLPAPVACYQTVWGSKDNPGLGLTAGQAIELCGGAIDAESVVRCFVVAWGPADAGGLGLNAGQAINLCKTSASP